jgi:hypothetical protein
METAAYDIAQAFFHGFAPTKVPHSVAVAWMCDSLNRANNELKDTSIVFKAFMMTFSRANDIIRSVVSDAPSDRSDLESEEVRKWVAAAVSATTTAHFSHMIRELRQFHRRDHSADTKVARQE